MEKVASAAAKFLKSAIVVFKSSRATRELVSLRENNKPHAVIMRLPKPNQTDGETNDKKRAK
jgi:hypothetical protein